MLELSVGQAAAPRAGRPGQTASEPQSTTAARDKFHAGVEMVRQAKWSEALDAFEASSALRPHAVTTFNIGATERALGRYTRARSALRRALQEDAARPGELTRDLRTETLAFLQELEALLARVDLWVTPNDAQLSVDGRPLTPDPSGTTTEYVGGLAVPGPGLPAPPERFRVVLDPGVHVFTFRRKGFADAVVRRTLSPGSVDKLDLRLERLPASIRVSSNITDSLVRLNGEDVGPVPVALLRPPGVHAVVVRRPGYQPYSARLTAHPGEVIDLSATLERERPSIFGRWWFWTGAVAVVAGGALATFALTREEPSPPPYDGGSTSWVAFPGAP